MDPLDALAADLRERLLAGAGRRTTATSPAASARSSIARRACSARTARADLVARIAERAFGLGPLEPLLADPAVDEIMVSGHGAGVDRARAAGWSATGVRFEREADAARRDRADPRAAGPARRRGRAAVRRAAAGRLAGQCRAAAARARRPGADDPPLPPARVRARGPRRERHADPCRCSSSSARAVRARATMLVCGGTGSGKTTTLNALSRVRRATASASSRSRTPPSCGCASRTSSGSRRARRTSRAAAR